MTYLDYNATTPVDPRVSEAMADVYANHPGNAGSRTHLHGDDCRNIVERARDQVAELAGVERSGVLFTSGATESDNLAILGLAEHGRKTGRTHIVTTAIEHKAVLEPVERLRRSGFDIDLVKVGPSGAVDADELLSRVREETLLVSCMHVNNETGVIQPVDEIGRALREDHPQTYFHIDAAQSFGKLAKEIRALDYDLLSATAHKMCGPQGVGALIVRKRNYAMPPIEPLMVGGGQERGFSPGTQPVALIAGFGVAAELCDQLRESDKEAAETIKNDLLDALSESEIAFEINGDQSRCLPTTLNVSFKGVSSEALMIASRHFASVSNGSACTSSSYEPSYVLIAMGLGEERAEAALRISWGRMTERVEAHKAFGAIINAARRLQD